MPRPARPWFRFYSEALESLKVERLSDKQFRRWIKLLALANVNEPRGTLPSIDQCAFSLRLGESVVGSTIDELVALGFIDRDGDVVVMHQWDDWQKDSDPRQTRGRLNADELRIKAGDSWVNPPPLRRGIAAESPQTRGEEESREEIRGENREEGEKIEDPPAHPFAFLLAREYQQRNGKPPRPEMTAAALALEREYGADACIETAKDYDWQKHPSYYRPILEEKRSGKVPTKKRERAPAVVPGSARDAFMKRNPEMFGNG